MKGVIHTQRSVPISRPNPGEFCIIDIVAVLQGRFHRQFLTEPLWDHKNKIEMLISGLEENMFEGKHHCCDRIRMGELGLY